MEDTPLGWFLYEEPEEEIEEEYEDEGCKDCEGTWFVFDDPGMDNMLELAAGSLDEMFDRLGVLPCVVWVDGEADKEMIFLARYEFPVWGGEFKYPEGKVCEESIGFVDFLGGIPYDVTEIMGVAGEISTDKHHIDVMQVVGGRAAPPVPESFFEGFTEDTELFNLIWLVSESSMMICEALADNLPGTPEPANPHWWYRMCFGLGEGVRWPVPGEFVALAPRIMPDLPWGNQQSNPFLFSGNWMETVHYTNCKILEVIDATKETPYPTYRVQYYVKRHGGGFLGSRKNDIIAKPTDFAEHRVDDRVTIVRNEDSDMKSWTWEDRQRFDEESWLIAPIDFYGKLAEYTSGV